MKNKSGLLNLGLFVVLVLAGIFAFNVNKLSNLNKQIDDLTKKQAELNAEQAKGEYQKLLSAVKASESSAVLMQDSIQWSKVLQSIRNSVPRESGRDIAMIKSYSGSSLQDLNIGVETMQAENPYFNVAAMISAFEENEDFSGVFVPGISESFNSDGEQLLSFNMSMSYIGNFDDEEENITSPISR